MIDDCVVAPAIPHEALPTVMFKRDDVETAEIAEYVEWQCRGEEIVTHAEMITKEHAAGQRYEAWDVHTDKGRWWVITPPTNLYSQKLFPSLDYKISFHIGLMTRVMTKREANVPLAEREILGEPGDSGNRPQPTPMKLTKLRSSKLLACGAEKPL